MSICIPGETGVIVGPVFEYVHVLEGRLRIKVPEVKRSPERARQIQDQFRGLAGIREVSANPVTGNVLFLYEPDRVEPYTIMGSLLLLGYMRPVGSAASGVGATTDLSGGPADHLASLIAQTLVRIVLRTLDSLVPKQDLIEKLAVALSRVVLKFLLRQAVIALI